jgi:hypothetical protein
MHKSPDRWYPLAIIRSIMLKRINVEKLVGVGERRPRLLGLDAYASRSLHAVLQKETITCIVMKSKKRGKMAFGKLKELEFLPFVTCLMVLVEKVEAERRSLWNVIRSTSGVVQIFGRDISLVMETRHLESEGRTEKLPYK